MEGSHLYTVAVVLIIAVVAVLIFVTAMVSPATVLNGTLYACETGKPAADGGYNATWYVKLAVEDGNGTLSFELVIGTEDRMTYKIYDVTNFSRDAGSARMDVDGFHLELKWVEEDTVWGGGFDGYYIASAGASASPLESRGAITAGIFHGFQQHFYVELRLR